MLNKNTSVVDQVPAQPQQRCPRQIPIQCLFEVTVSSNEATADVLGLNFPVAEFKLRSHSNVIIDRASGSSLVERRLLPLSAIWEERHRTTARSLPPRGFRHPSQLLGLELSRMGQREVTWRQRVAIRIVLSRLITWSVPQSCTSKSKCCTSNSTITFFIIYVNKK